MGLFQHKKEKGTAELPPTPPVLTPTEPDRANSEKMAVTASSSFGECADLCNSSRNRRIRMRKNRQISINAARSKTASSMLNISCTGDSE